MIIEDDPRYKPCTGVTGDSHMMGLSQLDQYVRSKIHDLLASHHPWQVIVEPRHARIAPAHVSKFEKRDKLFNYYRPTVTILTTGSSDRPVFQLNCFPGRDYVRHYAEIVATFCRLQMWDTRVYYRLPLPEECYELFLASNLQNLGKVDTVIIGYVDRLVDTPVWSGLDLDDPTHHLFAWHKIQSRSSAKVTAYLGCMVSFWGDIGKILIEVLHQLSGAQRVLYIGKTGALAENCIPNETLASGSASILEGSLVTWHNVLAEHYKALDFGNVVDGLHLTVPTPLCETRHWLLEQSVKQCSWVDCEVGRMAKVVNELGMDFAYLHIVSDTIIKEHTYGLNNERHEEVIRARQHRFLQIRAILESLLQSS